MDAPVTVVWIAPGASAGAGSADAEQARALSSYARAHGVRLEAPGEQTAATLPLDPRLGEDVERFLERARDALAARDGEAVDRMLGAAESTLRAHPEVPQAAWLMAEVERARSARLRRIAPVDEAAAAAAWTRAEALDGGRVAGVGEQGGPAATAATLVLPAGLPGGATVRLDGVAHGGGGGGSGAAGSVSTHAGTHALVVEVDGAPVWASWIEAPLGTSAVSVQAPLAPACSRSDVARTRLSATGDSIDATAVRCPSWLVATSSEASDTAVRIAVCSSDHCGPWTEWRAALPWTYEPGERPGAAHAAGWPTWATWGLVGAGAAVVAGGIVVLATGVLKPAPTETQFASAGVRAQ